MAYEQEVSEYEKVENPLLTLTKKIETLMKTIEESYMIYYNTRKLRETLEAKLSLIVTKILQGDPMETMTFRTSDVELQIDDRGVKIDLLSSDADTNQNNIIPFPSFMNVYRELSTITEFIDNINQIIEQIDKRIEAISNENTRLRNILQELRNKLKPLL